MHDSNDNNPKVMIVGAGIGGLMLALLLEKAGIRYDVFERSATLKPYGGGMTVGPNILPVFEQLGLYEEILNISLRGRTMDIYTEDMIMIGSFGSQDYRDLGYDGLLFSRPQLHALLLSKVPRSRIHYGKRMLSIRQGGNGVLIRCADGGTHEGDILVGADGANSAVRQNLYEQLQKEKTLPLNDTFSMNVGYSCLVGTTDSLDLEKYAVLKEDFSSFAVVTAKDKPHSWTTITVPDKKITWGVVVQLQSREDTTLRNSDWSSESIDSTIAQVAHHKVPFGGTLGDLIEATPKDLISKVYLEEKLFETWSHERVVLIGDACHKMLPSSGQGAINAMQDAVILANCLYDLKSTSLEDVDAALKDYKEQRYPHAKQQVGISSTTGKILYGQTWNERLWRKVVFSLRFKWFERIVLAKTLAYRPQATFLPWAEKRGTLPIMPQQISTRYKNIASF
ncbi:hypothetical protein BG011_008779 [Mortierella polycephala]|uniref:FAD-binding domain-containing protein n=1 Tax=Mortierella polycephala TaxID=41804 RepID=A0A9P6TX98_9FUNG|nr:hypothetical protein BG011_008779 [Mortierella polycephala]